MEQQATTLMMHRPLADSEALELKMLLSVVGGACVVVGGACVVVGRASVMVEGVGTCVVGRLLTVKAPDWAPQSFRVKTMVRLSPADRGADVTDSSER